MNAPFWHSKRQPFARDSRQGADYRAVIAFRREACLSAFVLDGAAISEATLARVAEAARSLGLTPGLAVVLVGSDPASQVYVGAKGRAAKQCGFHSLQYRSAGDDQPSRSAGSDRAAEPRSRDPRHSGAASAAERHRLLAGAGSRRSRQGRRRVPSDQCRPRRLRRVRAGADPLHAGGLDDPHRPRLRTSRPQARRAGGGGGRALQYRRQADGAASAGAQLHGDASPIPARATCPRSRVAPTCWSRRSVGRRWCGATG